MRREHLICAALVIITLIGFWPVGHLGFIIYDDHDYVTENLNVQAGITAAAVHWAFTTTHAGNWHPLTWLSHMLDCQLFGLKASGHHWTNLGFHIANTLLLFVLLREMTGAVWRSALVAALFAWHPLRVESVAWISERKDVLSGFFFMLTLFFYAGYARRVTSGQPSPRFGTASRCQVTGPEKVMPASVWSRVTCHPSLFYWLALVFFALGLMSKPMLVTLPVILLLIDFWPLGRVAIDGWPVTHSGLPVLQHSAFSHLLFEKIPFLALSLASSLMTFSAQQKAGYVVSADSLTWYWRIVDTLVFYTAYLGKTFWPANLAIFYPYRQIPLYEFVCSALLPVLLSVLFVRRWRSQPCLLIGWFWFLVMLLPVIGLVQVGLQSIADRYTYLPSIGLCIIMVWAMAGLASVSMLYRAVTTVFAAGLLLACLLGTRHQLGYWQDNVKLFSRSIEVTRENNFEGFLLLGNAFLGEGNLDEAAKEFQAALVIAPNFEEAHYWLGRVYLRQRQWPEAEEQLRAAERLNHDNVDTHIGLGDVLAAQDKYAGAEAEYLTALQLKPDNLAAREALAAVLAKKGETDKALTCLYEGLNIQPTAEIHAQIAEILTTEGNVQEAVGQYLAALKLSPDSLDALNNLAWVLATSPDTGIRDGARAAQFAERACELTRYQKTIFVGTLAAAYAEAGRFDDAMATAEKAIALAGKNGESALLQKNRELLELYRAHRAYHETR